MRVIPTGPDTIKNSCTIAGTYPGNAAADFLFDLLDFDYYVVDSEDKMDYMVIAGCLPAVYCRVDPHSNESVRDIQRFAGDFDEYDYSKVEEELSEESKKRMEWIEENAYRYGFVVRYQQEQEKKTGHWYQPFMLRYVGVKTAKIMHDSSKGMEQMSFPDELE